MKDENKNQSRTPHFEIPIIDGVFLEPLRKLTLIEITMIAIAKRCLGH